MVKQLETLGFKYREQKPHEKDTLWTFSFSKLVNI